MKLNIPLKFFLLIVAMCLLTSDGFSQRRERHRKFDPVQFQKELEQYITTAAGLTPAEAGAFFPVYREMQKKQRVLFEQMRRYRVVDTTNDCACRKALKKQDELDIELKTMQRDYHERFMRIISPSKVFKALKAEDDFHRQALRKVAGKPRPEHRK